MVICLNWVVMPLVPLVTLATPATAQYIQPSDSSAKSPAAASATDESSISHLPEVLQRDIASWRERLAAAKCLKVVLETDETWANLHELDASGNPRIVHREQFSVQSLMMPGSLWIVVYPFKDGSVDTKRPVFQAYWNAAAMTVWERVWDEQAASERTHKYDCDEEYGPTNISFGARGCIFASATQSWLSGPKELQNRSSVESIALYRRPNLAMVPPDPTQPGVWLDVFWDTVKRNEDTAPNSLYRRHDFMLLARDDAGLPEVREWRTLVLTDQKNGGKSPQQITGIRRFTYTFLDAEPAESKAAREAFVEDVERAARE
jgi:hypothetical protein